MSADPEIAAAVEKLAAMKAELLTMLEQVEELPLEEIPARRKRIGEILEEIEDAEEMADELEEQEAKGRVRADA